MKIQRLFLAFITITAIGFLYEKYKKKYEPDEETQNFSLVKKHLLKNVKNGKTNIWIHTDYNVNARNWASFNSRNTKKLNQPYLKMCIDSMIKWSGNSCNICLINDNTFSRLLDSWGINLDKLPEPLKSRTRYLGLLRIIKKYGGVIMPNSFLMLRDFKKYHDQYLGGKDSYVGEFLTRNKHGSEKPFFPNIRLVGCKKDSKVIKRMCDNLEADLSTDSTADIDFEDKINKYLYEYVTKGAMNMIPANMLGCKNVKGEQVLLDHLMQETKIDFDKKMIGLYIPKDELLKRINFKWFTRLNKIQIITSKTAIGQIFSLCFSN